MKSEIQLAFEKCRKENRPALISYTVSSDPNKEKSLKILKSISHHVDLAEIGFPFSTPIGDGSDIQTSSYRSIKNGFKIRDANTGSNADGATYLYYAFAEQPLVTPFGSSSNAR